MAYIDRLQKLQAHPGYNAALDAFTARFYGGEPALQCFEQALLAFTENTSGGDAIYSALESSDPAQQLSNLRAVAKSFHPKSDYTPRNAATLITPGVHGHDNFDQAMGE